VKGKQLHICIVTLHYHPFVGGTESRAAKLAHQLKERGHHVIIITARHLKTLPKTEIVDGTLVIRVGGLFSRAGSLRVGRLAHIPNDIALLRQLWRMRQHYDILHNMQLSPLSAPVALIGNLTRKPCLISIPSTGPGKKPRSEEALLMADTLEGKIQDPNILKVDYDDTVVGDTMHMRKTALGGGLILSFLKKSPACYHILSQRTHDYMTENGFRRENIVYIPNGIDSDQYKPDLKLKPDPLQSERVMLCVARLQYPKGIDILLHAWKRLLNMPAAWRTTIKPRLQIAGTGDLEQQLKWLADELGIAESVEFLGTRSDVVPLLQQAWGFVLPSRWEGMPNALLEAMGCGVPCIATRVSGSEDIVQDGINGLLVEAEAPAQLAEALYHLLTDTSLALKLGAAGRAMVVRNYQLSHITQQFEDLYYHMLHQEKQRPAAPEILSNVGGYE
jgi:Glycosyltransferase